MGRVAHFVMRYFSLLRSTPSQSPLLYSSVLRVERLRRRFALAACILAALFATGCGVEGPDVELGGDDVRSQVQPIITGIIPTSQTCVASVAPLGCVVAPPGPGRTQDATEGFGQ